MKIGKIKEEGKILFGDRLWNVQSEGMSTAKRRLVTFTKLVRITLDTFAENRMGFQCAALSYSGAMATIPFLAFIFFWGNGFGMSDKFAALLYKMIPNYPEIIDTLLDKSSAILESLQSGWVGLIGGAFFLWSILWMMFQVERVFNNVWGIRKIPRKMYKRFSFYFVLLILSPFILALFGMGIALYTNATSLLGLNLKMSELTVLTELLGWIGFAVVATLIFSAMYKWIPAPKVVYKNALIAALIAGPVFAIFQYLYLYTQMFVSRLNGVYGVIAAVPLFLTWMNFSWQIILYGAELCYALQHVDTYGKENLNFQDRKATEEELDSIDEKPEFVLKSVQRKR